MYVVLFCENQAIIYRSKPLILIFCLNDDWSNAQEGYM